jgi:nitroreductase
MEFDEVVKKRRSVRAYSQREVPRESIEGILRCADEAPTAGNHQPFHVLVVTDGQQRSALARACFGQAFIESAPVALVFFKDPERSVAEYGARGDSLFALQDTTIACAYAQLGATDLGLATCWVGAFVEAEINALLGAPSHLTPVAILSLGYAAEDPARPPRRGLSQLVTWGGF